MASADGFLRNATRLAIARACADGPRSIGDVAKETDRLDGALRPVFAAMERDGILEAVPLPGRKAKGYRLVSEYTAIAHAGNIAGAAMPEGAHVVTAVGEKLGPLLAAVSNAADSPHFLWARELAGSASYMACFSPDGAGDAQRLQVKLENNYQVSRNRVGPVLDARAVREKVADRLDERLVAELE
jgi:hypothetical protein